MTKEQLLELGLTEEQATKIVEDYGKNYVTKSQFNERHEEGKRLKSEVATLKEEFEKLSESNAENETLKKQIADMQKEASKREKTYEKELHAQRVNSALDLALINAKAKNGTAVKALLGLDVGKMEFNEDGTIKGLDERLKAVETSDPYLFDTAETKSVKGVKPGDNQTKANTGGITREEFNKMSYSQRAQLFTENKDLYDELSKGE